MQNENDSYIFTKTRQQVEDNEVEQKKLEIYKLWGLQKFKAQ